MKRPNSKPEILQSNQIRGRKNLILSTFSKMQKYHTHGNTISSQITFKLNSDNLKSQENYSSFKYVLG